MKEIYNKEKGGIIMELRTLHYFLAVAREENMTEAANVLHVTQPTLSRQMADLEAELGKKLFTRTNRSTVLTEEGVHLRQRAEEILSLVDQTEEEIRDDNTDLSGNIRIGAVVIAPDSLPDGDLRRAAPGQSAPDHRTLDGQCRYDSGKTGTRAS